MNTKRESNYDLLRIISCVAVMMIHVSATWVNTFTDGVSGGLTAAAFNHPFAAVFYNAISRFAVPCFVMLSGAFILDSDNTRHYKKFYGKTFAKVGMPALAFTVYYVLYKILLCVCFPGERGIAGGLLNIAKSVIVGAPMYHMWYLYMMIGVYALAPVVMLFKDSVSEKRFRQVTFVFLAAASLSQWTSRGVRVNWDIGLAFEYLGYFMAGYCIRKDAREKERHSGTKAILSILLALAIETAAAFINYGNIFAVISIDDLSVISPLSPIIVLASVLLFYGFANLQIKSDCSKLSARTFYLYLIHAVVWELLTGIIRFFTGKEVAAFNPIYAIPLGVCVVFALSYVLARIYMPLEKWANQKWHIRDKAVKLVRLS